MPRPVFSEREILYIIKNQETQSQSEIAQNLGELYPEDNAGRRTRSGVHNILQQIRKEEVEK